MNFEQIYRLSKLVERKGYDPNGNPIKGGLEIEDGIVAFCIRNKREEDVFDLVIMGPRGVKTIEEWAWYTEGYDQGPGPQKRKFYLKTSTFGGFGSGHGQSSKSIPKLYQYDRYLKRHLADEFSEQILEIS